MTDAVPEHTRSAWQGLPEAMVEKMLQLRRLILDTASDNPDIGPLEETLKWQEPAFLTSVSGSGTTVRINRHKKSADKYAFYVHCQTDLIERYKQLYDDTLNFDGNRAVVFDMHEELPVAAVRHCIAMALTYHLQNPR